MNKIILNFLIIFALITGVYGYAVYAQNTSTEKVLPKSTISLKPSTFDINRVTVTLKAEENEDVKEIYYRTIPRLNDIEGMIKEEGSAVIFDIPKNVGEVRWYTIDGELNREEAQFAIIEEGELVSVEDHKGYYKYLESKYKKKRKTSIVGKIGRISGLIISSCFYVSIGLLVWFIVKKILSKRSPSVESQYSEKSKWTIVYPWGLLISPLFLISTMNDSTGGPGYFLIYYFVLYMPIAFPLAIISTVSKSKKVYMTCNILSTIVLFPIILLGFIF